MVGVGVVLGFLDVNGEVWYSYMGVLSAWVCTTIVNLEWRSAVSVGLHEQNEAPGCCKCLEFAIPENRLVALTQLLLLNISSKYWANWINLKFDPKL